MRNWKLSEKLEVLGIALFIIGLFAAGFAFVSWICEEILVAKIAFVSAFISIAISVITTYGLVDQAEGSEK